jgi:hypothetical protein
MPAPAVCPVAPSSSTPVRLSSASVAPTITIRRNAQMMIFAAHAIIYVRSSSGSSKHHFAAQAARRA